MWRPLCCKLPSGGRGRAAAAEGFSLLYAARLPLLAPRYLMHTVCIGIEIRGVGVLGGGSQPPPHQFGGLWSAVSTKPPAWTGADHQPPKCFFCIMCRQIASLHGRRKRGVCRGSDTPTIYMEGILICISP